LPAGKEEEEEKKGLRTRRRKDKEDEDKEKEEKEEGGGCLFTSANSDMEVLVNIRGGTDKLAVNS